jgi:signal transduction histidine kinase
MDKVPDPNQMSIALAAQLFLSHFLVGLAALVIYGFFDWLAPVPQLIFMLLAAGILGLILNLNLQRSFRMLDWALIRLTAVQPITELSTRGHGALAGIMAKLQILAERERPFAQLRAQHLQQASEAAVQETRNRLARDLHDSIKQQLFSINISAAAAQARLTQDVAGAEAALDDVRTSAKAALVEMNALLLQLAPEPLAKVGLVPALQEQCEALSYRTGADVQMQLGELPDDEQFPLGAQEALFRIAQEALSNVARHARAEQVELRLETQNLQSPASTLLLQIRDDGQGFDETAVSSGMGLNNIRQRVQEVGGQLHITSTPGAGTTVQIVIPLDDVIVEAKEQEMYKPDHALTRFALVSFGGGVALTAVLTYPLYVLLPARFIENWPTGPDLSLIPFVFFAILLTLITGVVAARQLPLTSRAQNGAAGTVAGTIAGSVAFFMIGGSAATVWGSQMLLQHGFTPTQTEMEFLYYISESINNSMWYIFGSFWLVLLTAALLGTIGGFLTRSHATSDPSRWAAFRQSPPHITSPAHLVSLLSLFITTIIFSLLGQQVADAATDFAAEGFFLTLPAAGIDFWPLFTTFLIYHLILAIHTWALWHNRQLYTTAVARRDYLGMIYTAVLATAFLPIVIGTAGINLFNGYTLIAFLINFVFCLFLLWHANQVAKNFPALWREGVWVAEGVSWLTVTLTFLLSWRGSFQLAFFVYVLGIIIFLSTHRRDSLVSHADKITFSRRRLAHGLALSLSHILAITLPLMITPTVALGIVQVIVTAIPWINVVDGTSSPTNAVPDLVEKIQQLYWLQPALLAAILTLSAVSIGIVLIVIKLLSRRKVK